MQSVSTKTGDRGESGLANGQRLSKDAFIFEVLGVADELNSWLGLVISVMSDDYLDAKKYLLQVQDMLFYIGAELAQSPKVKVSEQALLDLEQRSESLQASLAADWTTKFMYPGGTPVAAHIDIARTVARKLERLVVALSKNQSVSPVLLKYINRLSDYLYVLRCYVNQREQHQEIKFEAKRY